MTTKYLKMDIEYCDVLFQLVNPEYNEAEPDIGRSANVEWQRIQLESDPMGNDLTQFLSNETLDIFVKKVAELFES